MSSKQRKSSIAARCFLVSTSAFIEHYSSSSFALFASSSPFLSRSVSTTTFFATPLTSLQLILRFPEIVLIFSIPNFLRAFLSFLPSTKTHSYFNSSSILSRFFRQCFVFCISSAYANLTTYGTVKKSRRHLTIDFTVYC